MFFQMLEDIDEEDVRGMIRFAWGRSKLPRHGDAWEQKFTIVHRRGGDEVLPEGDTCYFTIHLPNYSSLEIMKKRCLLAFRSVGSIDIG